MAILHIHKNELSPYKAVNQYIDSVESYAHETTQLLLLGVSSALSLHMTKSRDDHTPLIFKGKIMYSPATGKPILVADWKKLEAAITKYLGLESDKIQKKIVHDSFWLGNVIKRLSAQQRQIAQLKSFHVSQADLSKLNLPSYQKNIVQAAEQSAGVYLQNVTNRARSKIQSVIIEGAKQHKPSGRVFQDLWDQEEDINRDWERVVRSEIPANTNNGYLSGLLNESEEEYTFVKGISAPNACSHCQRLVNGVVAVVLPSPPKGGSDSIIIEGKEYPVLWPGKNNFGRRASQYWSASTIHPYCRCTWTEWYIELERYLPGGKK